MNTCSSFASKGVVLILAWVAGLSSPSDSWFCDPFSLFVSSLRVELSSSSELDSACDSFFFLISVTTIDVVISLSLPGEFTGAFFEGLVALPLRCGCFFGRDVGLTGVEDPARESIWSASVFFYLLLLVDLLWRWMYLLTFSFFCGEPVTLPLSLLLGINHLGVIN